MSRAAVECKYLSVRDVSKLLRKPKLNVNKEIIVLCNSCKEFKTDEIALCVINELDYRMNKTTVMKRKKKNEFLIQFGDSINSSIEACGPQIESR
jgi:presenilin-like A22 family membrane protease